MLMNNFKKIQSQLGLLVKQKTQLTLDKNKLTRTVSQYEPAKVFEMQEKYVSPLPQGRKYNVKNMRNVETESCIAFIKHEVLTYRNDVKKKMLTI